MKNYIRIVLFVVVVIAIGSILTAIYFYNLKHKDLRKVKPDFVTTAVALQKEFEDNEPAATAKYLNKIIELSGTIKSVKEGEGNITTVTLKTGSDISSVICTFPSTSIASRFVAGNQITLRGECSGFLMDVLLNNCTIIEH